MGPGLLPLQPIAYDIIRIQIIFVAELCAPGKSYADGRASTRVPGCLVI